MRLENTWQEIRDHSFIQIHSRPIRFPAPCWCFFSSVHHSFSIGFRSEDWNDRSGSLGLCSLTHFCVVFEVCVWIIVWLEDPNMAHYKSQSLSDFFNLLVFDRIHDAMCLKKIVKQHLHHHLLFGRVSRKVLLAHPKTNSSICSYQTWLELQMGLASMVRWN